VTGGDAVENAAHQPLRRADHALIGVARKRAFEQEQVGGVHQRALKAAVKRALECVWRVVQRAAMRRVDANDVVGARTQAEEGAGLGAMAVQHVRLQLPDQAADAQPDQQIRRPGFTTDGDPVHAEFEARRDLGQCRFGAIAAGQTVGDNADLVAALGLSIGEIDDMAENAANRCTRRVQDPQRSSGHVHPQNLPSPAKAAVCTLPDRAGAAIRQRTAARAPDMGEPSGRNSIPIRDFHG
jgi:hypothetical protein